MAPKAPFQLVLSLIDDWIITLPCAELVEAELVKLILLRQRRPRLGLVIA
jgi:BarA-like signal transduction histidine kinase